MPQKAPQTSETRRPIEFQGRDKQKQHMEHRQDNQCDPPKDSRNAIDFQSFASTNKRKIATTYSDKSLTAATECCCSFNTGIKVYTLPNLC